MYCTVLYSTVHQSETVSETVSKLFTVHQQSETVSETVTKLALIKAKVEVDRWVQV